MSESTNEAQTDDQLSAQIEKSENQAELKGKIKFFIGQECVTTKGNKYHVTNIARESGNIEDLFVVYNKIENNLPRSSKPARPQAYVRKINDLTTIDDLDDGEYPQVEIEKMTNKDAGQVEARQHYRHFKTLDEYIVKDIAIDPTIQSDESQDSKNEPQDNKSVKLFVIYEGQYNSKEFGGHPVWIREYNEFAGMKVFDENEKDENGERKKPVKRFGILEID